MVKLLHVTAAKYSFETHYVIHKYLVGICNDMADFAGTEYTLESVLLLTYTSNHGNTQFDHSNA